MKEFDLKQYAENKLEELKEYFDEIKTINQELLQNSDLNDKTIYYEFQNKLTGIYAILNPLYKKVRALKENKEVEYYNKLKLEADVNSVKFVSAVAERKASEFVAPLRLLRDILEGYIESIVMTINTCRTRIYEDIRDRKAEI